MNCSACDAPNAKDGPFRTTCTMGRYGEAMMEIVTEISADGPLCMTCLEWAAKATVDAVQRVDA